MGIGMNQLLIILLIAVVVFGASKLPQIGEGMGKAIRNFKKSVNNDAIEDISPKKITEKNEGDSTKEA